MGECEACDLWRKQWGTGEAMGRAAGVATRPAESCVLCGDALDGDAEAAGLVDEVVGDAGAGERDDALGEQGQEFVVAAEGSRPSVCVPIGLADDLVDAVPLPAQPVAIFSAPGPPPWTSTTSAYFALSLSRCPMMALASFASLPPATATSVPWGRCAVFSRSLRALWKSRASIMAEVSLPVCEVWEPWRGRHVSPVSVR